MQKKCVWTKLAEKVISGGMGTRENEVPSTKVTSRDTRTELSVSERVQWRRYAIVN